MKLLGSVEVVFHELGAIALAYGWLALPRTRLRGHRFDPLTAALTGLSFAALIGALAARLSDGATRRAGWAAAAWRCCHWTEPKGGHFGAFEPPARLVDDLRAFFRPLR